MFQRSVLAAVAIGLASGAAAQDLVALGFTDEDCVSAVISSPAARRALAEKKAREEYRKPTAAELNVGTHYEILVWNDESVSCRNIRPSELVVTDAADNVRARFPLVISDHSIKQNVFGTKGAFFTAAVRTTKAALKQAFGADGIAHVLTSGGKRSAHFEGASMAQAWETPAERETRRQAGVATEIEELKGGMVAAVAASCESDSADGYIKLAGAIMKAEKALQLGSEAVDIGKPLLPYEECLQRHAGTTLAGAEARSLLRYVKVAKQQ